MSAKFFLGGIKVHCQKYGRRVLLADKDSGQAVMLLSVRFHYAGVWISTRLPCKYVYTGVQLKSGPSTMP
jgi:hypothetical protein